MCCFTLIYPSGPGQLKFIGSSYTVQLLWGIGGSVVIGAFVVGATGKERVYWQNMIIINVYIYTSTIHLNINLNLQPTPFELATWNLNHEVYVGLSQNIFSSYFENSFLFDLSPLFIFHNYFYIRTTYNNKYIKTKLWITKNSVYRLIVFIELWRHQMTT